MPTAAETLQPFERALDWLADGVALIRAGGQVLYSNQSFRAIAQRDDGIAVRRGMIQVVGAAARTRLNAAIVGALAPVEVDRQLSALADFPVSREDMPPYLVSVRPLVGREREDGAEPRAIVFVRDPLTHQSVDSDTLREVFALTEAEACLAKALQGGQSPAAYARARAVSLNTVYTHLRHLKDKTGCNRMTELIRKLNELQVPLRLASAVAIGSTPNTALTGAQISPILVTQGLGPA
jgi:DNA-binding CsgD family transcriptional regulator